MEYGIKFNGQRLGKLVEIMADEYHVDSNHYLSLNRYLQSIGIHPSNNQPVWTYNISSVTTIKGKNGLSFLAYNTSGSYAEKEVVDQYGSISKTSIGSGYSSITISITDNKCEVKNSSGTVLYSGYPYDILINVPTSAGVDIEISA